jgi:hypothetical protein
MLARHAVLLTRNPTKDFYPERPSGSEGSLLNPPIHLRLPPATPLESTLVDVFILNSLNLFRINSNLERSHIAQFLCNVSPFRINTSKTASKQATLSTFRINIYEKQAGSKRGAIAKQPFHRSVSRDELVCFQALAHSLARPKTQLFYFQALPHSFRKNTRGGSITIENFSWPALSVTIARLCAVRRKSTCPVGAEATRTNGFRGA